MTNVSPTGNMPKDWEVFKGNFIRHTASGRCYEVLKDDKNVSGENLKKMLTNLSQEEARKLNNLAANKEESSVVQLESGRFKLNLKFTKDSKFPEHLKQKVLEKFPPKPLQKDYSPEDVREARKNPLPKRPDEN
jgi:hypothetical protein